MAIKYSGLEIECIELYPVEDTDGTTVSFTISLVARGGKCCRTDQVHRRHGQTLYGHLMEVAAMVRHMTADST